MSSHTFKDDIVNIQTGAPLRNLPRLMYINYDRDHVWMIDRNDLEYTRNNEGDPIATGKAALYVKFSEDQMRLGVTTDDRVDYVNKPARNVTIEGTDEEPYFDIILGEPVNNIPEPEPVPESPVYPYELDSGGDDM